MNVTAMCFCHPSILKIPFSNNSIFGCERGAKATNVCEVNLTPRTVYLIAAVPEMRDEEERLTPPNESDLVVNDPNMQRGQIRSSPGQCPNSFRSLLGNEII